MPKVERYDLVRQELAPPARTAEGFARLQGFTTRKGVFEYETTDGKSIRELRLQEHVFDPASLATFDGLPVTIDHPPVMLDATNATQYARGVVMNPAQAADGTHVMADVVLHDAEAIDAARSTHRELSLGYRTTLVPIEGGVYQGDGEFKGTRADFLQTEIEGNHLSLVPRARAGSTARLRLDAAGNAVLAAPQKEPNVSLKKITIDGTPYEVPEHVAVKIDALESAAEKTRGERDALRSEIDKLKTDSAPEKIASAVKARTDLALRIHAIVGGKIDELAKLDEAELMRRAILKRDPKAELKDKSIDYLRGRLDTIAPVTAAEQINEQIVDGGGVRQDGGKSAADKYREAQANGWKAKETAA